MKNYNNNIKKVKMLSKVNKQPKVENLKNIIFFSKLEVGTALRILHIHLCTMCSWIILHILDLAPASQQTHRPKKLKGGAAIVEGFLNGLALKDTKKKFQDFEVRFFKA